MQRPEVVLVDGPVPGTWLAGKLKVVGEGRLPLLALGSSSAQTLASARSRR